MENEFFVCQSCGEKNPVTNNFCQKCATPLTPKLQSQEQSIPTVQPKAYNRKKRKVILIIALILLGIIIISVFSTLKWFNFPIDTAANLANEKIQVGDIVYYGSYEQDDFTSNDGKEKIAWRVLALENGKALLLSEKILDSRKYSKESKDVAWETCTLRKWLNSDFYNTAFTTSEKNAIEATSVMNSDNPDKGTNGGNDTKDKVFLLSNEETRKYLANQQMREAKGTLLAKYNGLYVSSKSPYLGNSSWWLRSPVDDPQTARYVSYSGGIFGNGETTFNIIGVRPAIWIASEEISRDSATTTIITEKTTTVTEETNLSISVIAQAKVGDIVKYGNYEQDNNLENGKEQIAWRVLAVEEGKAFLLADKILDVKPYNAKPYDEEYMNVTWETCTLREWLNNYFYNIAFTTAEKVRVLTSNVENGDSSNFQRGNNTQDKIFLLSPNEVTNPKYGFSAYIDVEDNTRQAQGTDYAKAKGLWSQDTNPNLIGSWWLRAPHNNACYAGFINNGGASDFVGFLTAASGGVGVRPALWLNLK